MSEKIEKNNNNLKFMCNFCNTLTSCKIVITIGKGYASGREWVNVRIVNFVCDKCKKITNVVNVEF